MNDIFISKVVKARPGKYQTWWVESKIFILLYPTCLRPAAGDGLSGKNSHLNTGQGGEGGRGTGQMEKADLSSCHGPGQGNGEGLGLGWEVECTAGGKKRRG